MKSVMLFFFFLILTGCGEVESEKNCSNKSDHDTKNLMEDLWNIRYEYDERLKDHEKKSEICQQECRDRLQESVGLGDCLGKCNENGIGQWYDNSVNKVLEICGGRITKSDGSYDMDTDTDGDGISNSREISLIYQGIQSDPCKKFTSEQSLLECIPDGEIDFDNDGVPVKDDYTFLCTERVCI